MKRKQERTVRTEMEQMLSETTHTKKKETDKEQVKRSNEKKKKKKKRKTIKFACLPNTYQARSFRTYYREVVHVGLQVLRNLPYLLTLFEPQVACLSKLQRWQLLRQTLHNPSKITEHARPS
jgi:hypothetical protein